MQIRREDLYAQIWRQPMTKVASRLEVSSNYLARVCESLNVPHPPRGYWARRAAGEKLDIPPLAPAKPGDAVEWVRGQAVSERASFANYSPPPPKKAAARVKARSSHHALVTSWQVHLEHAAPTELGYLRPLKRNVLDAFITKGTLHSASATLNALFNELENRGHTVRLEGTYHRPPLDVARRPISDHDRRSDRWEPGRATIAVVANIPIGLSLFELTEHVRVRRVGADRYVRIKDLSPVRRYAPQSPDETDMTRDMPTGRLVVRAYSPIYDTKWSQEWEEGAAEDFVTRVSGIVEALEAAAPQVAQLAAEAERRAEEQQRTAESQLRVWRQQAREKARAEARRTAVEELHAIAEAWTDAHALEVFFEELGRRAVDMAPEVRADLESRMSLARQLLGGEDAIQRFLRWRMPSPPADSEEDDDT